MSLPVGKPLFAILKSEARLQSFPEVLITNS